MSCCQAERFRCRGCGLSFETDICPGCGQGYCLNNGCRAAHRCNPIAVALAARAEAQAARRGKPVVFDGWVRVRYAELRRRYFPEPRRRAACENPYARSGEAA